ncbi:uncharacterized protein LOC144643772 [Oculina patagonica]
MKMFLLLFVLMWIEKNHTFASQVDECHNYKTLSEADRAQGNVLQDNKRCDQLDLTPGWYRFQGAAGDQIPDKCVDTNRCGTSSPGWLSGAHPTVAEGVVTRKVCYHWWDNCCFWSNNIKVKNCSDFYVYELQKPPFCDLRYCGNAGSGTWECGSVVNNTLTSPGYPDFYPNNMDCNYSIPIPPNTTLEIVFHDFFLARHFSCSWDYLKITNGSGHTVGTYCGLWTTQSVILTGDHALITFHTDDRKDRYVRGFKIFIYEHRLECGFVEGFVQGLVQGETLKSPGYPNNYPSNIDCRYLVQIPFRGALKVVFFDFDVQDHPSCGNDYLKITNNDRNTVSTHCGQKTGHKIIVSGGSMLITFHSDGSVQRRGYKLLFMPILYIGSGQDNAVHSPEYPSLYPPSMECVYSISVPRGMAMKLHFHDLDIVKYRESCNYDYLEISNEDGHIIGTYCGQKTGESFIVAEDYLWLLFYTAPYTNSGKGFLIFFSAVPLSAPRVQPLDGVVRALPNQRLPCSATGIPPIYTALIRNSTVLVNTTNTASIRLHEEGNYSCVATSKYGTDRKEFSVVFTACGSQCSHESGVSWGNTLSCRNSMSPFNIIKCAPTTTEKLYLSSNSITFLPEEVFANLTNLEILDLSSNAITFFPDGVFSTLIDLKKLNLSANSIGFIPKGLFANLTNLHWLSLASNNIQNLTADSFSSLFLLYHLDLSSNNLQTLSVTLFLRTNGLIYLDLSYNNIQYLSRDLFCCVKWLQFLNLTSNSITFLPYGVFTSLPNLLELYLAANAITFLGEGLFPYHGFARNFLKKMDLSSNPLTNIHDEAFIQLNRLKYLFLSSTNIQNLTGKLLHTSSYSSIIQLELSASGLKSLPVELFEHTDELAYLDLSYNKLQHLPKDLFGYKKELRFVFLQNNLITSLSNETFSRTILLQYVFLHENQLENIPYRAFYYISDSFQTIMLSDNPIKSIEKEAFNFRRSDMIIYLLRTKLKTLSVESVSGLNGLDSQLVIKNRTVGKLHFFSVDGNCTIYVNPLDSDDDAIEVIVEYPQHKALVSALTASGFGRQLDNRTNHYKLLPCPLGTFSNSSSKGSEGCITCPPGGFYSDTLGHVNTSCQKCPTGSFVAFDKAPGTQAQDCKSCPFGTDTDFFAGYRGCKCLKGFYRTHMFEQCYKCGQGGLKCQDDYASLNAGYWWKWRNETQKDRYRKFIKNLLATSPALDAFSVQYPFPMPTPHMCPMERSCNGGLDSRCNNGYEGPLCGVCSSGYYKQFQVCKVCPSKKWIVGQLSIIAAVLLVIILFVVWTSKRKTTKNGDNQAIDTFFSKLKIIIGFYQVTYGLLEAFSYIKWPDSLEAIAKYSGILQMNVLHIAPFHCLFPGLHIDAFGSLFAMMAINAAIIGFSGVIYSLRKVTLLRKRGLDNEEKSRKISKTKELVYRNLFFFLYVTYLSTCSKTVSVIPLACQKLCRDEKEEICEKYLKADYSVQCHVPKYNHLVVVAYISAFYIIALPAAAFIVLFKQRRLIVDTRDAKTSQDRGSNAEMITGLRFLFENYKPRSWYWELVEMTRKVILTSGLILVGQESRSYIGLAWVIAGMYGMQFSFVSPIGDAMDNRLMATSLAITVVNLGIGAVSRIPAENIAASSDQAMMDTILFKILVFGGNTLVIGLVVVQYAVCLYRYLNEWRKNPHWSFSCCLAVLLPLSDMHGEFSDMAGTNVLNDQLQNGQMETANIFSAVKDSGAVDITIEGGQRSCNKMEARNDDCQDAEYDNKICHKETQTESQALCDITDSGRSKKPLERCLSYP